MAVPLVIVLFLAGLIAYWIARRPMAVPVGIVAFVAVALLGLALPGIEVEIAVPLGLLASAFAGMGLAAARPRPATDSEQLE